MKRQVSQPSVTGRVTTSVVRWRATSVVALAGLGVASAWPARAQQPAQAGTAAKQHARTADADAAYAAGEKEKAARAYEAVLAAAPDDSRALYMLALLRRDRVQESIALLDRYVRLEPGDAWGHIALGEAYGRAGGVDAAEAEYEKAERLAPDERDVVVGKARLLARNGRTDRAIATYDRWLARHPRDVEARRELSRQYRKSGREPSAIAALENAQRLAPDAATARALSALRAEVGPRVEPEIAGSSDSDRNRVWRAGGIAGFRVADAVDLTVGGGSKRVSDGSSFAQLGDARFGIAWRPRATMRLDVMTSIAFAPGDTATIATPFPGAGPGRGRRPSNESMRVEPNARLRYVWQDANSRARVDLRATRSVLDASPLLVFNDVVRSEIGGEATVPIAGPLGVRATTRAARISSTAGDNSRTLLGARVVGFVFGGEITAGLQQIAYEHASSAGYFAPRWSRTAEVGAYREFESQSGVTLALDLGVGTQRVTEWSAATSAWAPAMRGWGAFSIPVAPGRQLRFEVEAYDAKVGNDVATTAERWHYLSASLGLRWSLR